MRSENLQLQLQFERRGIPYNENEKQYVIRNLHLNNQEIARTLGRSEASVRIFLSSEQIRRSEIQLQQIRMRVGAKLTGANNPNFKNWRSRNNYYYKMRSISRYPERDKARKAVYSAVRSGKLIPQSCEVCENPKSEAHHDSYLPENWLIVRWLCKMHHKNFHKNALKQGRTVFETDKSQSINSLELK